jgi:hypothetical protein
VTGQRGVREERAALGHACRDDGYAARRSAAMMRWYWSPSIGVSALIKLLALNELDAHVARGRPDDLALTLNLTIFVNRQSECGRQISKRTRSREARSTFGHVPNYTKDGSLICAQQNLCRPAQMPPP